MEFLNIVSYAQQLKSLLISHEQAVAQLNLLDCRIDQIDQYLFEAEINGSHGYRIRLMTKRSTFQGSRKIYNQYKDKKWEQIQELSSLILKATNPASNQDTNNIQESSQRGRQLDNDSNVQPLIEDFSMCSRDN